MCAALLSPNCRDAFLRLSQQPSLRDWRFYSAILLAETQECVSTTFRRTHVNTSADKADIKSRWKPLDLFEALPVILPPNTCQLFPWDRIVRCLQLPAAPRGTRIVRQFLPAAPRGARIVRFSFPRLRVGQESCDFPSRGSAWGKNRATIPSRGFAWDTFPPSFPPADSQPRGRGRSQLVRADCHRQAVETRRAASRQARGAE